MTTAAIHEQTRATEREIAALLVEAYTTLNEIRKALPLFANGDGDPEDERYVALVQSAGESLAPTLARASRLYEESQGIEADLGTSFPYELPRFIHLLEDTFVLFWSVRTLDDLKGLARWLPAVEDERAALDPAVTVWIKERGGSLAV